MNREFSSRTYFLLVVLLISVASAIIIPSIKYLNFAYQADEGYYLGCATFIGEKGFSAFPSIFKIYFSNPLHRITQNPLRVGFFALASGWIKIFGSHPVNLILLSLFSYGIFLVVTFSFVRKYFKEKIALLFTVLLTFSPLNMAMARRALVDSTANLFLVGTIFLFFENLQERNPYKKALWVLVYAFSILIKEGSALLSVFFLFYLLIQRYLFKRKVRLAEFGLQTLLAFGVAGSAYVVLAGGWMPFLKTAVSVLTSTGINNYALVFCAGPWFRYLLDFLVLSPWVFILATGYSINVIIQEEHWEVVTYLLTFVLCFLFLHSFLIKNIRYLISLDMPLRLFALLMLNALTKRIFNEKSFAILVLFVIMISVQDVLTFYRLFVARNIYDPVSYNLLQANHIIP